MVHGMHGENTMCQSIKNLKGRVRRKEARARERRQIMIGFLDV